jgi:phage baseplate assembly protein W
MKNKTFAPKLPFQRIDDTFLMIENGVENTKQKLKMIILTNPGEKIMDPQFGAGIRRYLFENPKNVDDNLLLDNIGNNLQEIISEKIRQQVAKYADDINISDISITIEDNRLNLTVDYKYRNYTITSLTLSVS